MLHEVGLNINHSGLHRHSAYILQNSDLPGFNQEQQLMMATSGGYHRKAIKLDDLPRFTLFKKKQFPPLIQLLRLAYYSHQRQATTTPPTLTLITDGQSLDTAFPHDWFSQNALVLLDLEKEQEYWEGVAGWRLKIEEESTPEIAAYCFAGRREMSARIIQALSRMGSISFSVSINGCGLPIR